MPAAYHAKIHFGRQCHAFVRSLLDNLPAWHRGVLSAAHLALVVKAASAPRFHLEEATIADVQRAIRAKEITAERLVLLYFKRIEAAQVQGGNVYLHAGSWVRDFLEEAESFPNSPHLDQVDAAAMAFHHLTKGPVYDPEIWERVCA
jgi:hypothetical protein